MCPVSGLGFQLTSLYVPPYIIVAGKLYNVCLIVKQGIAAAYETLPVWCTYHKKYTGFSNVTTALKEPGWSYTCVYQFFSRSSGALTIVQITWLV